MEFVKLNVGNDWGYEYLFLHGDSASARNAMAITDGEECTVRFPDGKVETVRIEMVKRSNTVYDHGHGHTVDFKLPCFSVDLNGLNHRVMLLSVEVERSWAEAREAKKKS